MLITHQPCDRALAGPRTFTLEPAHAGDLIARKIRQSGQFYEQRLLDYLARRIVPGGLVLDIGANIGNHAVYFGAYLADALACVEPVPALADRLEANLKANGIAAARVFRCGAGAAPGQAYVPASLQGVVNSGAIALTPSAGPEMVRVPVRTVDDLAAELAEHRPVTLMKIDVEGMQDAVLAGASAVLRDDRPQLVIEAGSADEKARMMDGLGPLGYQIIAAFGSTATYHLADPARHALRPLPLVERMRLAGYRLHRAAAGLRQAA